MQAPAGTGNSSGGSTLYLAAVDERVRVAIPACAFSSHRASILSEHFAHCLCNYVPGLLVHFEAGDVAALIAPRPLRIISGERDDIFLIGAAREQFVLVRRIYAALGAEDRCDHAVHPQSHRFDHDLCAAWLERWQEAP